MTDPPTAVAAKEKSPQFGRVARRTQSPELSPQGDNIFCKQCITNQHFVQQNLAEYIPDPSHPKYNEFIGNLEQYKKDLEKRYPQVCANCAPRVNARLAEGAQAARADHLRHLLAKKDKPLLSSFSWQRWGLRRIIVFIAGVAWWASVLGQTTWHLLGVLPPAEKQMRLSSTSWYAQWTCAAAVLASQELQQSCLHATAATAWYSLVLGLLSFWWNSKLSQKLYSRDRRLVGLGSYLVVQLLSLVIRGAAFYALEYPQWLPAETPASGIHGAMLAFMVFSTSISMTTVKLSAPRRPNLTDYHPVEVDPTASRPAYQDQAPAMASQTTSYSTSFPISALSQTQKPAIPTPPDTQVSTIEDEEMDWTPTGPSKYTQFSYEPQPEYRRPDGPNPFRGTLPPAPKAPAHKIRNPKQFLPASQEKKSNFMKEIRGELRAATGTPSDDEDGTFGFGGRKKSNAGFVLNPGNMRDYRAEGAASGLEDLFNSAFTIKENKAEPGNASTEASKEEKKEQGYVIDGETVRERMVLMRTSLALGAILVVCFALAVGMNWIKPKSAIESLLYEKDAVEEVHEVIEDFVEDYIGT